MLCYQTIEKLTREDRSEKFEWSLKQRDTGSPLAKIDLGSKQLEFSFKIPTSQTKLTKTFFLIFSNEHLFSWFPDCWKKIVIGWFQ
jgi:hypothetical protein